MFPISANIAVSYSIVYMFSKSKTNLFTFVYLFSFTASAYVGLAECYLKVLQNFFFFPGEWLLPGKRKDLNTFLIMFSSF